MGGTRPHIMREEEEAHKKDDLSISLDQIYNINYDISLSLSTPQGRQKFIGRRIFYIPYRMEYRLFIPKGGGQNITEYGGKTQTEYSALQNIAAETKPEYSTE